MRVMAGLRLFRLSERSAKLTWVANWANVNESLIGNKFMLYVSKNLDDVLSYCSNDGAECVVKEEEISINDRSYTSGEVLEPGTLYYWLLVVSGDQCDKVRGIKSFSSCGLQPSPINPSEGQPVTVTPMVNLPAEAIGRSFFNNPPALNLPKLQTNCVMKDAVDAFGATYHTCDTDPSVWQLKDFYTEATQIVAGYG